MKKEYKLTFYKSELAQYNSILTNNDIRDKISYFLLRYVSVEAFYKKLLIAYKEGNGKKLTKSNIRNLRVQSSDVTSVLEYFQIECNDEVVERIFGSNDKNYMDCSIKKLRDRLVHRVNDNVLLVILERYDSIMEDLDKFLEAFK